MNSFNATTPHKDPTQDDPDFSEMASLHTWVEMDVMESTRFLAYCEIRRWANRHPENFDPRRPWFEEEVLAHRDYLARCFGARHSGVALATLDEVLSEERAAAVHGQRIYSRWNRYLTYGRMVQKRPFVTIDSVAPLSHSERGHKIGGVE